MTPWIAIAAVLLLVAFAASKRVDSWGQRRRGRRADSNRDETGGTEAGGWGDGGGDGGSGD
jgi:hypothetical protein